MRILSCAFNIDTTCVELRLSDGTMISIDCTAVENEVADNMYQRSELDWLIYNSVAWRKILCKRFSTKSRILLEQLSSRLPWPLKNQPLRQAWPVCAPLAA